MISLLEAKTKIISMLSDCGVTVADNQLNIIDRGTPHKLSFVEGKMYIYTFKYEGTYLKIGKAGSKSKARFYSHHYKPNSSNSNLAKSILKDPDVDEYNLRLTEDNIGEWIKSNVNRTDFEVDISLGIFILNFIESTLHCIFKPKYEGSENQRE